MTPALPAAEPFAGTLVLLALVWLGAKVGGELAQRLRMPAVAGELGAGLALAALHRWLPLVPDVAASEAANLLANLGIIVLMFAVGLQSTVPQMLRLGAPSLRVAVIGVVVPMAAGFGGAWALLPAGTPFALRLFIGACLCATSIGISAQVLRERGAASSREGRVIVGAAVIDDVLGLLVLVAVTGLITAGAGGGLPWASLGRTLSLATLFLSLALTLGRRLAGHLFHFASRFRSEQLLLPLALAFAFLLAWLGQLAGLAPIVGAYAAGLLLEPAHVKTMETREDHTLEELVHPLVMTLAPVFFVVMGARVDTAALLEGRTLLLACVLTLLGVAGKYVAGYGAGPRFRASIIGWGMVPRGEVGLIFVAVGSQLQMDGAPLLGPSLQAGIVGALLLTTILGPIGLGWILRRA
jgi:Kef-type K+ transport system membrane component KefB